MPRLELLFTSDEIQARCDQLAAEIDGVYKGEPVVLLGVLKGSYQFVSDLSRRLQTPCTIDFVQVSSYGDDTSSSGAVRSRNSDTALVASVSNRVSLTRATHRNTATTAQTMDATRAASSPPVSMRTPLTIGIIEAIDQTDSGSAHTAFHRRPDSPKGAAATAQ